MMRDLFLTPLLFLTACASSPYTYFPDTVWAVDSDESYFRDQASSVLNLMNEPHLSDADSPPAFRMLMLTGVTPIHAVRIMPEDNGAARVETTVLDAGYRIQGSRKLSKRKNRLASKEEFSTFLAALENKSLFRQNAMPLLEDYHFCMHASYFIYEFRVSDKHDVITENYCAQTSEGRDVMKAFYAIGNITSDQDWSLLPASQD